MGYFSEAVKEMTPRDAAKEIELVVNTDLISGKLAIEACVDLFFRAVGDVGDDGLVAYPPEVSESRIKPVLALYDMAKIRVEDAAKRSMFLWATKLRKGITKGE